jgi:hypothetical protein
MQRRRTKLAAIVLFISAISSALQAETGMCLVTTGTSFADLRIGNIVRIDIENDLVKAPTAGLGYGVCPRFSPDGKQICFLKNGSNTIQIINIDGGAIRSFSVDALPGDGGTCSWTTTGIWIGVDGKITKYDTLGNKLAAYNTASYEQRGMVSRNEITAGGVYINGTWKPRVYQMRSHTNLSPTTTGDGCSVCPNPSGLLLTNNLRESTDGIHRAMRILDTNGVQKYYLYLKDATPFSAASYHWDMQTWSGNSDSWILIPVGTGSEVPSDNCSPCLYNISTAQKICVKDNSGTNVHWQPFDYYSGWIPTTTNPVLQLSPMSLAFAADSGTINPPSQTVIASTSTGVLLGISTSGAKPWLTSTPSGGVGTNVSIANSVTIAQLAPNIYRDTVTVNTTNASGKSYTITLTIRKPTTTQVLSSMDVTPHAYTVAAGASIAFVATCKDQNGDYFIGAAKNWSVSGGGTIDATGKFTAAATPSHGPQLVIATATANGVTLRDTAKLIISVSRSESVHKRIDSGTNSFCPAGWETDNSYVNGGSDWDNSTAVTTAGVEGVAPDNVYKSSRRGNPHSYQIVGLPQGSYTIRMHFIDPKDTLRLMSYTILGVNVLRDFSIASLAGGANKGLVLDFSGMVQDSNGIPILCTAASGDVFEAGVEVIQNNIQVITLLSPLGGEQFKAGQTVPIKFTNDTTTLRQIYVDLSVDNGLSYHNVTGNYGIKIADYGASWGTYNWTIPDSINLETSGRLSTISTTCRIRVRPYSGIVNGEDFSDSTFTIGPSSSIVNRVNAPRSEEGFYIECNVHGLVINASSSGLYTIEIFSLAGKRVYAETALGRGVFKIPQSIATGMSFIRMKIKGGPNLLKTVIAAN